MDKSKLSEADICEKFISPALVQAGWDVIEAKDKHHAPGVGMQRSQLGAALESRA